MAEQKGVFDLFSFWHEWNKTSQELWSQIEQSWKDGLVWTPEQRSLWYEWNRANQELWNQMLRGWLQSDGFNQIIGKAVENALLTYNMSVKATQSSVEQALGAMQVATTGDIARISEISRFA